MQAGHSSGHSPSLPREAARDNPESPAEKISKMATARQKNDTPPRGGNWSKLETPGDVRRLLRWLILQTKANKLDVKKAGVMGQLAIYLLKTLEVSDLEQRLRTLEQTLATQPQPPNHNAPRHVY
jgi:hypothetical protein